MKQNSPDQAGIRKPVLFAIIALALTVGGVVYVKTLGGKPEPVAEAAPEPVPVSTAKVKREPASAEPTPAEPAEPPLPSPAPAPPVTIPRQAIATPAFPSGPEPSPETRRLVSMLANLDLNPGTLTPEAAAVWKQNLQALIQNGAAAVPALQEFLALNKDVNFDAVPGAANLLGSSSLRLSLLESLANIGGPEAIALSAQTLQFTTDPREIALLAGSLERQAPEQYREMALSSARAAIAQATAGQLSGKDIGPLFGVLTQFGGAASVADLQQAAAGPWKYYSTIALSQLPDGAGVPALISLATDPSSSAFGGRNAAYVGLGGVAPNSPEALNTLRALARQGSIPDAAYLNIASALGGDRFQIGTIDTISQPNVRTWHLNHGNQNYYAAPEPYSPGQIDQRISAIQQLIPDVQSEAGRGILQAEINKLQARKVPPGGQ